ncbi:sugar ABC transporter substrate-binding protein [bacterium]|nr:sugar ABC transporter substrate-binding protein [bacterium]
MKRAWLILVVLTTVFGMVLSACSQTPEVVETEEPVATEAEVADGERSPFSTDLLASDADPSPVPPEDLPITGIGAEVQTDVKADEEYKIAIVVKNTTNPFLLKSIEGAMKAGVDTGVEVVSLSPARQDSLEDQVKLIEDAIQQGVQGIVLHPIDSNGIMPVIRKCDEAGIPVAVIGTPATNETFMRTGVDYTETGRTIGTLVADKIEGTGKVIILEGPPGAQNAQERLAGIQEALSNYPDIEIVASQTTNFKRIEGLQVTENLLQKYPDVDAIIAANDESTLGALQALKAAGIEGVVLGSFDGNQDASAAIQDGDIYATYNVDPFGSTYLATVYIVMWLNDGTMPPKYFVPFPSVLQDPVITQDNIDYYIENIAWWK